MKHGFIFLKSDFDDYLPKQIVFYIVLFITAIGAWQAFNAVAWRMTALIFNLFGLN